MYSERLYINRILINWYKLNKRDLPWRETADPYRIWISEIILQQTRVNQGYDYYIRFIEAFPDIKSLAEAPEDEVLKLGQGLGYYSRARNLHHAAKSIMSDHNGVFPSDYKDIISLKGIGEYTAAAIASFCFDQPYAVVDGNVFRLLSRLFAISTPIDSTIGKREFTALANELINKQKPGLHNQAIMEFGSLHCVPVSPDCPLCPLNGICLSYANNEVANLPVKQGKTKITERFFNYFEIHSDVYTYINKRTGNDIWKNLYEFPLIETDKKVSLEELIENGSLKEICGSDSQIKISMTPVNLKHILSHQVIYATFYKIELTDNTQISNQYYKIPYDELHIYAVSRLTDRYLTQSK